jgi:anaerobic selenocysteine-containing dehydrogenase
LPVCSAWEREGLQAGFQVSAAAEAHMQLRPAFVPPQGESRSDTWIVFELAKRLGLADQFFGGAPEAALTATLAPTGLTPEVLRAAPGGIALALETRYRKYEQSGFATPSGRLELHSERLRSVGLDPLPDYIAAGVPRDPRFPLTLTTAKWPQYCHSQQRNQPSLRKRMPEPLVETSPGNGGRARHPRRRLVGSDHVDGQHARPRQARSASRARSGVRPIRLVAIPGWGG